MYKKSIEDPASFWSEIASQFYWEKKWDDPVCSENFDVRKGPISIQVPCLVCLVFPRAVDRVCVYFYLPVVL